jgi:GNAT superfamily N-acetyltransferase
MFPVCRISALVPRKVGAVLETPEELIAAARVAGPADAKQVTATVTAAFASDPVWSWAAGGEDPVAIAAMSKLWRLFVDEAFRYEWLWQLPGAAAMSLWIPPGGTELSPDVESRLDEFLAATFPRTADRIRAINSAFEQARPHDLPHFYLSLLAAHPLHRGDGLGMALLRHNLHLIDNLGVPAYLESTNSANLVRYASVGFEYLTQFQIGADGPVVTTMSRPAQDER